MEIKYKKWVDTVHRIRGETETRFDKMRLDKNERISHLGEDLWRDMISKIKQEHILSYPEIEPFYSRLAGFLNVSTESLVVTAGADFAIKIAFELFVNPGEEVIVLSPTFAMIEVYCDLYCAKKIEIGYDLDLNLDIERLMNAINERVSLVVIANPNSPTGTYINHDAIVRILDKAKRYSVPVLVDEAYWGFCSHTVISLLNTYENLIIVRTFSKTAGLAGLRVGYAVSSKKIASLLYKFKPMYEVNSISILFASEILDNWQIVDDYIAETEKGKQWLLQELRSMSYRAIDTYTNFIHVDFGSSKDSIINIMEENNILLRGGLNVSGYENYTRVSVGPKPDMEVMINCLVNSTGSATHELKTGKRV